MPTSAGTESVKPSAVPRYDAAPCLSLIDLEAGDCRYPYGGDEEGEAITFCGHPQREGSSYCVAAFSSDPRSRHRDRNGPPGLRPDCGSGRRHEIYSCLRHGYQDQAATAPPSYRTSAG